MRALVLLLALAACAPKPAPEAARAPDPNGLLHAMQACLADPAGSGCTEIDRARGFVVIKDDSPQKPDAWLIVPDHEVTGIEDPRALRPPVSRFWSYGWEVGARLLPHPAADRPRASPRSSPPRRPPGRNQPPRTPTPYLEQQWPTRRTPKT